MTAPRRPQLSLDELQQLKWLLGGVLTLLALSTVFYMDVEAWTIMGLTTLATLATLAWPTLPSRVPPLVHTLAFPAIVAFFAGDLWLRSEVLPAMVRLDMLLLLYRNVTYRQRRDDLQVIVLGLFLIIVAGVLTVSLVFAAQLLVYTACALGFLFTITLSDRTGKVPPASPPAPNRAPAWAAHGDWPALLRRLRDVADWRVIWLGVGLFAGVVAVSALLFLAIPRFQLENGMFLDRFITKKAKSGFSEQVRFGDVTDILQDTSIAMSVDVDPAHIPATPYWRMLVLDEYRDGAFKLSPLLKQRAFQGERTYSWLAGAARMSRGPAVYGTIYLESGVSRFLPLLGPFQRLTFVEAQNFAFSRMLNVVALRQEPVTMTAYRVEGLDASGVLPDETFAAAWSHRNDAPPRVPLQNRTVNSEADRAALQRVVNEIADGQRRPAADFAARAGAWLRSHHGYSLSPRIPSGDSDPLVRWMTSREAGHCELFAGSFVLLARAAGFPARLVTGFKGGSWNAYSGNFTIRNSDAHAWAEIFDAEEQGGAWLRTDPLEVPNAAQAQATASTTLAGRTERGWSARFDSLRVFWYRRIVSFDQRSQAETLKTLKEATQNSGKRLRVYLTARLEAAKTWLTQPWSGRRFARVATMAAALIVAGWLLKEFGATWWRGLFRTRGARHEDPVRREAGRWLARLRREREESPGTAARAEASVEADAAASAEARRVEDDLLRLRYGARATWPEPEKVFRRARRAVLELRRRERSVA